MKRVLIVIAFLTVPFLATAQSEKKVEKTEVKTEISKPVIKTDVTIKKIDPISINPKTQNLDLNFKKSKDIISVNAYIKSLQLKRRKASVMS